MLFEAGGGLPAFTDSAPSVCAACARFTHLFARGISKALLAGLLRDGLATWSKVRAGIERPLDIVRVKITDAGRQALE
jgi:hypothetical protein